MLLSRLSDYYEKEFILYESIQIGQELYYIKSYLSRGSEGILYIANDNHDEEVVIKAYFDDANARLTFDTEVNLLERLDRLLDWDDDYLILVQVKISGLEYAEHLLDYSSNFVNDYPSNHIPKFLKNCYFQTLYDFRNSTGLVHNDFHPYNIIGDTVIDFGRSEVLSEDYRERSKQILYDDKKAQEEWEWFYLLHDVEAIESNPKLPNAISKSESMWEKYFQRYDDTPAENELYKRSWMDALYQNLESNDTFIDFPLYANFY